MPWDVPPVVVDESLELELVPLLDERRPHPLDELGLAVGPDVEWVLCVAPGAPAELRDPHRRRAVARLVHHGADAPHDVVALVGGARVGVDGDAVEAALRAGLV